MSHFLWLFHVENVLHHDKRVQVAGKKGEEKLEKRIRKRALLIIWRLHVSQFKLAAGLFFLRLPRKLKFNLKMPRKTAGKKCEKAGEKIVQQKWANFVMVPQGGWFQRSKTSSKGCLLEISFRIYGSSEGGGESL